MKLVSNVPPPLPVRGKPLPLRYRAAERAAKTAEAAAAEQRAGAGFPAGPGINITSPKDWGPPESGPGSTRPPHGSDNPPLGMPGQKSSSQLGLVSSRGAPEYDTGSRSSGSDPARSNRGMVGGDDGDSGWGHGRSTPDAPSAVVAGSGNGGGMDGGRSGFGTSGESSLGGSVSGGSGRNAASTAVPNRSTNGGDVAANIDGGGSGGSGEGKRSTLPTGVIPAPHAKRHRKSRTPSPNPTNHAGPPGVGGDNLNTTHAGSNGGGGVMKWRGGANSIEAAYAAAAAAATAAAAQGGRTGAKEVMPGRGWGVGGSGGAEGSGSWGDAGSAGGVYSNHGGCSYVLDIFATEVVFFFLEKVVLLGGFLLGGGDNGEGGVVCVCSSFLLSGRRRLCCDIPVLVVCSKALSKFLSHQRVFLLHAFSG